MPRDSRIAASEAAAIPFPSEETTPPDTNTYLVIEKPGVGMWDDSRIPSAPQRADEKSRKNSRGSPSDDASVFPPARAPIAAAALLYARRLRGDTARPVTARTVESRRHAPPPRPADDPLGGAPNADRDWRRAAHARHTARDRARRTADRG